MSRTLLLTAALGAAALLPGAAEVCPGAETSSAEQKIEQALAAPTQLEFIETPLQDVVDYLKDFHGIEIQIDEKALEDSGIGKDSPITKNLKGISLRSALELMLRDLELTYTIEHEVLLITTREEAKTHLITTIYPVADLVTRYDLQPGEAPQGELADYDTIIEIITSTVEPSGWDEVGGPGAIAPGTFNKTETLVISQTYHVHRKIAALLAELRKVAGVKQE